MSFIVSKFNTPSNIHTCSFSLHGKEDSLFPRSYLFLAGDRDKDEDVADEPGDVGHGVHQDRHQEL